MFALNDESVKARSALSKAERHKILYDWNDTGHAYDRDTTLHDIIAAQAERVPDRVALIYEQETLTYAALERRSNQLARALIKQGVEVESLVGLFVDRSLDMIVGILGILKAGGAYVPIDPDLPPARIQLMVEDADMRLLLAQERLLDRLPAGDVEVLCLDRDWPIVAREAQSNPAVGMHSENLAYVIYTSGSTGKPKGAQNMHRSIVNLVSSMARRVGINEKDNVLATTTLSFDPSVWEIFLPLTQGARLTIASREAMLDGRVLQETIERHGVTFLRSTPTGWRLYLASGWQGGPDLKILSGGEKLPLDLARQLQRQCAVLWHTYGPAEAAVFCTMGIVPENAQEITIGRPHDNIQIYILDEEMEPVPVGVTGELYIGGDGVGRGYWNRPRLTAERFLPNPFHKSGDGKPARLYRTGDLARFREDGEIIFAGRDDQQIKLRGRRIELGEIDRTLLRHRAISQSVTVAREERAGDAHLVAYLIAEQGHKTPDRGELRAFLASRLPDYMVPVHFIFMDRFPVSPNGKLDRLRLPPPSQETSAFGNEYAPPRDDLEREMAQLFAEILQGGRVNIFDSFFELGGNSLLAVRLLYEMEERFGVKISMRDFLQQPQVAGLCRLVAKAERSESRTAGKSEEEALPFRRSSASDSQKRDNLLNQSNLTQGQFLMWMGQQMNPEAPLYNVVHAFTIRGRLDQTAFAEAFQGLVDRHDALRTIFHEINGVPQQQVLDQVQATLEFMDYSHRADAEDAWQAFLEQRQLRIMPMDQPLYDALLIKLGEERFIWYLGQHHILTDAVSSALLFERLGYYYQLALEGRLAEAPEPPQYGDFVASERELRTKPLFQQAAAYWRNKYGERLPPSDFYGKRVAGTSTHTTRVVHDLGSERSARLRTIAREGSYASPSEDMSLFTIFATLLFTTLHRLNGQKKLRLGTPFHGRPTAQSMDIAGLFIEMGVMQVEVEEGETFASLSEKVMAEILDGLAHVQPGISSAEINRAYDVILNFIQSTFHEFAGLAVQKEQVHTRHIDAGHNLRLQITDYADSGRFTLLFDMKTSLFGEYEREWLVAHFLRVLDAFIADPERPLGDFSLLSDEERQQLLVDFNDTDAPYPSERTVVSLFEEQAARSPLAIAAVEGADHLTYQDLNQRANRLAHFLQAQGVGPDAPVAICMERSLDALVAIWGVLKSGGAYIPIDPTYPAERMDMMLNDAKAALLLVDGEAKVSQRTPNENLQAIDISALDLAHFPAQNLPAAAGPEHLVYLIYTSGSTGTPKGTMLTHQGLMNYTWWARRVYQKGDVLDFPLYSSLAFDLTVTSIFVPLLSGGKVVIYRESKAAPGMEILSVFEDDAVDIVKLTPAHLRLARELQLSNARIRKLIVGGEDFKTDLALTIHDQFQGQVAIYNEYGPTEAVVGCMIHRYDPVEDNERSVPIGRPAANARIYLLDAYDQPVPPGVVGEMVISSDGVARGYHRRPQLTAEKFGADPFRPGARIYRSGDIARWNAAGEMVFLGRKDHQVKIGSARIELGEIEARMRDIRGIEDVVVNVVQFDRHLEEEAIVRCVRCGLPSNYPEVTFNEAGICSLCTDFDTFRDDVWQYFKTMDNLHEIVERAKAESRGDYDCMMLYSGGKDSTYVLSQLVDMGLRVLAFSLDNGFISEEALDNVRRVTDHLGVDLVIGQTPHMNAIFTDSLERYSNVCQGCYKTIYTLSMILARKRGIKIIFTGLSRGQLFETRLDELFRNRIFGVQEMDEAILAARKIYHSVDDAVKRLLDVSMFRDEGIFQDIQFVDYFRYTDVQLEDVYDYLATRVPWIRPSDTGRSTNCLINEAGIFVHQTERGYHNYALPYSWDVRLGHKTREEVVEELNDDLRLPMVRQMLDEVGYRVKDWHADQSEQRLAAYFVANGSGPTISEMRDALGRVLPAYMMPAYFVRLQKMPLTVNGKIDRQALPNPTEKRPEMDAAFVAPESELEMGLAEIWSQTLNVQRVGVHDNFFDLGGASIPAVQIVAKISDRYGVDFPVRSFFEQPTVAGQSKILEELLVMQLETMSDEDVERLLAELGD